MLTDFASVLKKKKVISLSNEVSLNCSEEKYLAFEFQESRNKMKVYCLKCTS